MRKFWGTQVNYRIWIAKAGIFLGAAGLAWFSSGCTGLVSGTQPGNGGAAPLAISNVQASNPTPVSVAVSWQTNLAANSQVEYGTSSSYGSSTVLDMAMVTNHQETLLGLKPGTLYHFRAHSSEVNDTLASGDMTFTTVGDTVPPTISVISPIANTTLSGTTNITANASDNVAVASVQFKVDNANTGAPVTSAPYTYSLNTNSLSNGNHIFTAVATDTSGNSSISAGVPVKVNNSAPDTTPPVVAIISPANNATVSGTVTITATATDPDSPVSFVQFQVDGVNTGAQRTVAPYTLSLDTTKFSSGSHTLTAIAQDPAGNQATSTSVAINVALPAPAITSLNPTSGAVGTSVIVTGANFGAAQGASAIAFNGTTATPTAWSATSIVASVPAGATTGNVVVTVGGQASNGVNFTVTSASPNITGLNPASGVIGTPVTITGANFGASQGSSTVKFNGAAATPTTWSTTSIVVPIPSGATTGNVIVTVGGQTSNGVSFTVTTPAPNIVNLNPASGLVGTPVTITGTNFGTAQGSSSVKFNGTTTTPTSWSATSITAPVPAGATTGNVVVTVAGQVSNGVNFTVIAPPPGITSLNPTSGLAGASVTITGANFGASQGSSTVKFNGTTATATSWSTTSIVAKVPNGASTGNVVVTVGGQASNGTSFTVLADTMPPAVTVTAPANNASVAGTITLTATATDPDSPVSFVQFLVDGSNAGGQLTSAPYSLSLDTTTLSNAPHAITAIAKDPTGNQGTSASVTITVNNAPPVVTITSPANNATVSGTVTLTAAATGSGSLISFVQFLADGSNVGTQISIAPFSLSLDTTTLSNGAHTLTAIARDLLGNQGTSPAINVTVSNSTSTSMGPLKQSTINSRYFVDPSGKAVFLAGSHTWNEFQDTDTSGSTPAAFDFNSFVNFLKQNGHNATILWRKDLPQYCGWNFSGSVWNMAPWPWQRTGPGLATDSRPKFDLTQFNQAYFDRLRADVQRLQQNGIYAFVELFDGNQLTSARCSTDGYPFTGANNINGVDDGYSSGSGGTNSVTMSGPNSLTGFQDAYVKKILDTINDLPNVIYEVAEEQPAGSANWWFPHIISLVHSYEATKPFQHLVGIGSMNASAPNDGTLYGSTADWIAPTINTNFNLQFPSNVSTNNQGKIVVNDSDHSYFWKTFTNSDGSLNNTQMSQYLWENVTSGAAGVVLMDPYLIYWPGSPNRNLCNNPVHQICTGGVDTKFDQFRANMGFAVNFVNTRLDLVKMTPQGNLSSTGFCLADNVASGAEYLVYAPNGGSFTVNLSATAKTLNVEWLNPNNGTTINGGTVSGGLTKSFTAPFNGDAVLYLVDVAGHN